MKTKQLKAELAARGAPSVGLCDLVHDTECAARCATLPCGRMGVPTLATNASGIHGRGGGARIAQQRQRRVCVAQLAESHDVMHGTQGWQQDAMHRHAAAGAN